VLERRALALALVLAIHVMAIVALCVPHGRATIAESEDFTTIVFFVPPAQPVEPSTNTTSRLRRPSFKPNQTRTPSDSITSPQEPPPPAPIDWRSEGDRAAVDMLKESEELARRRTALDPHGGIQLGGATRSPPGIAWDIAHTKRIEPLAEGGALIHLNDHCVIVFPFMFPFCKVGKIEPRGDLFSHMNDPPADLTRPSAP
jgi:hypothetical protein